MKILVIGASGLIGHAVADNLAKDHQVIRASRNSGDIHVDITSMASVKAMFEQTGELDAVIIAAGRQSYGHITQLSSEEFALGLNEKVMGQINVVLAGQSALRDGGSFTLTSGIITDPPFPGGICAHTDNAALESFVRVAATELPHGLRINAVSPAVVIASEDHPYPAESLPAGLRQITAADVALRYRRSIEEGQSGSVYNAWG